MKLVRDGIPQIIEDDGRACKWRHVMGEDEHIAKLAAKMREEVGEFIESPCYEEAADMIEVVKAFCFLNDQEWEAVLSTATHKEETHGGFHAGIVLMEVDPR